MSLKHRKDKRTIEEFSKDLKKYHRIESTWAEIQRHDWVNKGIYERVDIVPFGSDDDGKVWEKGKSGRISKPDYIFRCYNNGSVERIHIIEMKAHPSVAKYPFFTYKVSSFKNCIKYNGTIITPLKNCKLVYSPKAQKIILERFKQKIYYGFSPNDEAVRITNEELEKLIKEKVVMRVFWHPDTIQEIETKNFLFT